MDDLRFFNYPGCYFCSLLHVPAEAAMDKLEDTGLKTYVGRKSIWIATAPNFFARAPRSPCGSKEVKRRCKAHMLTRSLFLHRVLRQPAAMSLWRSWQFSARVRSARAIPSLGEPFRNRLGQKLCPWSACYGQTYEHLAISAV